MQELNIMIINKIGVSKYNSISGIINEIRQDGYDEGYEDGRAEMESELESLREEVDYYMGEVSYWQDIAFENTNEI